VKSSKENLKAPEGTDTWRHMTAGAVVTVFLGPESTLTRRAGRAKIREIFGGGEADFLLIEGMKTAVVPRFWCIGNKETDVGQIPPNTQAVVAWEENDRPIKGYDGTILKSIEIGSMIDIILESAIELESIDF
jgi:molybdopterin-guanine dinucleotide biosynthesis protein MobB